jgi:hypothetical protein
MRLLRGLALGLMGLTIAFLVGEGALRLFLAVAPTPADSPFVADRHAAYRLRPTPPELVPDPQGDHINNLGFRDREHSVEKPPGTYRILGVGDSFVYGNVPFEENFLRVAEDVLEARLALAPSDTHSTGTATSTVKSPRAEDAPRDHDPAATDVDMVLIGLGGYGPDNELGALRSFGLPLAPDLAVLNFFVGNDVIGLAMPARVYRGQLYFVGSLNPWVNVARKSRILLLAESALVHRTRGRELARTGGDGDGAEAAANERDGVRVNATYLGIQKKRLNTYLREPSARMRELWLLAEEYVLEFDRVCAENGIDCMVHVIPAEIQVDPDIADQVFCRLGLDPSEYDLELPQRRLKVLCGEAGIPLLDPLERFREQHRPEARLYLANDTHWNVRGNRLAGEMLAEFIEECFRPGEPADGGR